MGAISLPLNIMAYEKDTSSYSIVGFGYVLWSGQVAGQTETRDSDKRLLKKARMCIGRTPVIRVGLTRKYMK